VARKASRKGLDAQAIGAAMTLAAERGWSNTGMIDIAERAKVPVVDLIRQYPSKLAILAALFSQIDEAILADVPKRYGDLGDGARDRLFELLMARFDALAPYKEGVASVLASYSSQPLEAICVLPRAGRSMALTLELAGISTSGLSGALRVKGLLVAYGDAFRTWLGDDSQDLTQTMAALDRNLQRAEKLAGLCWPGHRRTAAEETPPDES